MRFALYLVSGFLGCVFFVFGSERAPFPEVYNSQKETIPLLKPEEALKRMKLPAGFEATVFAGEPDVRQPIAMAFDARGRLWVAENYTYSEASLNFDLKLRDRIVIFEDSDGDGRFDKRTVFWDEGERLTGIAVGWGGVFATCPPKLIFIPDRDGNDQPDGEPQVLLDGFDADKIRHTLANGLKFGPDGWLYGRHGIQATSLVGKPGSSAEERLRVNGCIWRYHPTRKVFEIVAQGTTNPWGSDWDEYGEMFFINTVIGHLWHALPGAYFKRMYGEPFNPHIYELIDQVADHVHWDRREAWNDINKGASETTSAAGGGHAHTGLMMYLGDNWPAQYRNEMFTLNFHGKRINSDHIERAGADYVAHHGTDFMFMGDPWFRGIDLMYGPDGGVFVADWSDIGECHDHDGVHRGSGRIYKITYGKPARVFKGDLSKLSNAELVDLVSERNEWFVRMARQILQERAARGVSLADAAATLERRFNEASDPRQKLRYLWALHATGALKPEQGARPSPGAATSELAAGWLRRQLAAENEHLRVWAIRLLVDAESPSPEIISEFARMAGQDRSGLVLSYLASALQRISPGERWPLGRALAARGDFAGDRVLPLMIWYGMEAAVSASPEKGLDLARESIIPKVRALTARRVFEEANANPAAATALVGLLGREDGNGDLLQGITEATKGGRGLKAPANWEGIKRGLIDSTNQEVRVRALQLDARFGSSEAQRKLLAFLSDTQKDVDLRHQALEALVETRSGDLAAQLPRLIDEPKLGPAAIRAMGTLDLADAAPVLIDRFKTLPPESRRQAVAAMASRPRLAMQLLQAVQRGRIPRTEVDASTQRQLRNLADSDVREKLAAIWPQSGPGEKRNAFARYKKLLTAERLETADAERGHTLFRQSCATCHKLFGEGAEIGPDLTGADRRNVDYLLENVLNPSGIVPESYRVSTVNLKDDRVLTGIVTARSGQSLTLQTTTEKLTVPAKDVESIHESELSMMPDGLFDSMTDEQVADLVAYLISGKSSGGAASHAK